MVHVADRPQHDTISNRLCEVNSAVECATNQALRTSAYRVITCIFRAVLAAYLDVEAVYAQISILHVVYLHV